MAVFRSVAAFFYIHNMKQILFSVLLASFALLSAAAAKNQEFFLYHAPTESVLGPYEFATGEKFGTAAAALRLSVIDETRFSLTDVSGATFGPFSFAENAPVKIGAAEFTISTNAEVMLQKRTDRKLWKSKPETNPKVLAVLRGDAVEGFRFLRAEPDAVFVSNPTGIYRISLAVLPEDIQQKFAYDPATAAAYAKDQTAARAEWDRKQAQDATAKADAVEQVWTSIENIPPVAQPDYPPSHFPTAGLGSSSSTGGGNGGSSHNRGGSSSSRNRGP